MRTLHLSALALWLPIACAHARIPNTDVPDTSENRAVVGFCERYRHAVESRDARALLAMASPRYYEDGGTPAGDDDYGLEGLDRLLTAWADEVHEVRYEIRYRRIAVDPDRPDRLYVEYTFTGSYTLRRPADLALAARRPHRRDDDGADNDMPDPVLAIDPVRNSTPEQREDDVWYRRVADNRLELERQGEDFHIVSGM